MHRAFDTRTKTEVAIKELRDNCDKVRFATESTTLMRLDHKGIIKVIDVAEDHSYVAMDLVEGETLKQAIDSKTMTISKSVNLMIKIANAIHYAHEQKIIHRDLKPSNIIIRESDGEPVILDFGLAKEITEDTTKGGPTATGEIIGTLRYMSPEQASGKKRDKKIDHRTDIYSLGAIFYEMVTGVKIFRGYDGKDLFTQIYFEPPTDPTQLNSKVGSQIKKVILKALAKNPSERYQSAKEFAEDLDLYRKTKRVTARIPKSIKPKKSRTRAAIEITGIFALICLLGWGLVIALGAKLGSVQKKVAKLEAEKVNTTVQPQIPEQKMSKEALAAIEFMKRKKTEEYAKKQQLFYQFRIWKSGQYSSHQYRKIKAEMQEILKYIDEETYLDGLIEGYMKMAQRYGLEGKIADEFYEDAFTQAVGRERIFLPRILPFLFYYKKHPTFLQGFYGKIDGVLANMAADYLQGISRNDSKKLKSVITKKCNYESGTLARQAECLIKTEACLIYALRVAESESRSKKYVPLLLKKAYDLNPNYLKMLKYSAYIHSQLINKFQDEKHYIKAIHCYQKIAAIPNGKRYVTNIPECLARLHYKMGKVCRSYPKFQKIYFGRALEIWSTMKLAPATEKNRFLVFFYLKQWNDAMGSYQKLPKEIQQDLKIKIKYSTVKRIVNDQKNNKKNSS